MRALVPFLVAVLLAAGCGDDGEPASTTAEREFAPVDISRPLNGDRVQGRAKGEELVGKATVEGTAEPGAEVRVSSSCEAAGCAKPVEVDSAGRFEAEVDVAAPAEKAGASLVAEYTTESAFDSDRVTVLITPPSRASAGADDAKPRKKKQRRKRPRAENTQTASSQPQPIPEDEPSSPEPEPAPSTGGRASGRLVMIGDSLAQGTEPYLGGLLDGWDVTTDAARGRPLAAGMRIVDSTSIGASDVLAISLFTNDGPGDVAALRSAVRRSAQKAGCVIWATIVRPPVGGKTYAEANRALAALDAELGDRMALVPWAQTVGSHPEYLAGDGVHATPAGYRARAQLYANAARSC